jgi:pyridoxal phosphate enzyme (YggS family)
LPSFADRLAAVRERVRRTGRDLAEVAIVAVSKGRSLADCREAIAAGLDLGENRVQEALPKLAALPEVAWHLVGHLQSNKVPRVAGRFRLIQSLDSVRLAELLAARDPRQAVLLQVNVSREPAKSGVGAAEAVAVARQMSALLSLEGLMAIAPLGGDPEPAFRALADLRRRCQDATGRPLPILSMGMSGDYEAACRAGSTMLRLGRVLFDEVTGG